MRASCFIEDMVLYLENCKKYTQKSTRANMQVYQFHSTEGQYIQLSYIFIWQEKEPGNLNMKITQFLNGVQCFTA